jgi:hypothetical protein
MSSGIPTGKVTFYVNGTAAGTGVLNGNSPGQAAFNISTLAAGSYSITAQYAGDSNFIGSNSTAITQSVTPLNVYATLTASPGTQQYSDPVILAISVPNVPVNGVTPLNSGSTATFSIGSQNQAPSSPTATTNTPLICTPAPASDGTTTNCSVTTPLLEPVPVGTAPPGQMAPGTHVLSAVFSSVNPNFTITLTSTPPPAIPTIPTLTITPEDARVTYAGNLFYGIPQTSTTGLITLVATISDITALCDPSNVPVGFSNCAAWAAAQNPSVPWDPNAGNIRNATVTFVDRSTNMTLCTAPVLLINSSDTKTGSVTCQFTGMVGNTGSTQYTVGIVVNGYYSRNMSTDNALVTISQVGPGMITGGGYLVMKNSAGTIAGDPGTHNNLGFNVQYKSSAQNPHGNINSIVRRMEKDGIQHVYQIKGNSMSTLAVYQLVGATSANGTLTGGTWNAGCTGATSTSPCKAQFNGNANIQDITNPLSPVSVTGNNSLQFNMTDYGTPGSGDTLGVTLWNSSGGIWFSTNWMGTPPATVEQLLGGGNLVVH